MEGRKPTVHEDGSMTFDRESVEVIRQALANYYSLWDDFLDDIDDGRWRRSQVVQNIAIVRSLFEDEVK